MPSADQVPIKLSHLTMLRPKWVVLIAGSTGSALRAVRPPNLHITPVAARSRLRRKRDGLLVSLALDHHGPDHSRELVGKRDSRNLGRPPCQQGREPGPMFGAMDLSVTDDGERAGHEQAAQIAVTLFAYVAKPAFASTRVLLRHDTDPGREVASRSEGLWISNGSDHCSGQHRTDPGSFIEPHAHLVGSVPGPDQSVELQYLLLDPAQLSPECRETRTSHLRNSLVIWIGYDIEQFLDTVAPGRCNDPELG